MFKTANFYKFKNWIPRLVILSTFAGISVIVIIQSGSGNILLFFLIAALYFVLIGSNQIEEIEIRDSLLIHELKSFVPFLNSKVEIPFGTIDSVRLIADQTVTEKGWAIFQKKRKNIVLVTFKDHTSIRINGMVHPDGAAGLMRLIQEKLRDANTRECEAEEYIK